MKNTALIGILVVIIVVAGVVLLSSGNLNFNYPTKTTTTTSKSTTTTSSSPTATTSTTSSSTTSASTTSTSQTAGLKEFTVHESNFKITDATGKTVSQIKVNKGDTVKINVIVDSGTHDLYIDGYNRGTQAASSGNQTLEFLANKVGTFDFYCRVDGHKLQGMLGQFVVSAS